MNSSHRIHQLPEWEDAGYAPSVEYSLPVNAAFEDACCSLDVWMRSVAERTPNQVATLLHARWESSLLGSLEDILRYFLQYQPRSVVTREDKSWLFCELPASEMHEKDFFLIRSPIDPPVLRERLAANGFTDPEFVEFLMAFAGFREDFEPGGGAFVEADGDWILINQPWMVDMLTNYEVWQNGLIVFNSRGGDGLVMHPTGKVGWWHAGDSAITNYAADVSELCHKFAQHKSSAWVKSRAFAKLVPWPFDGYKP